MLSRKRKEPQLRELQWIVHYKTIRSLMLMHMQCRMFQLRSLIQLMIITEAVWMNLRSTISCLPWETYSARFGKIWTSHQWQELKQQASTLYQLSRVSSNKHRTITAEAERRFQKLHGEDPFTHTWLLNIQSNITKRGSGSSSGYWILLLNIECVLGHWMWFWVIHDAPDIEFGFGYSICVRVLILFLVIHQVPGIEFGVVYSVCARVLDVVSGNTFCAG